MKKILFSDIDGTIAKDNLPITYKDQEAVKKLKEDAVNGYHAGTDAISQSLFLFSKDRKELVVYEA